MSAFTLWTAPISKRGYPQPIAMAYHSTGKENSIVLDSFWNVVAFFHVNGGMMCLGSTNLCRMGRRTS